MTWDWSAAAVFVVVFSATLTRSSFGFGDALLAMPLLSIVIGVKVAAPLMAFISVTTAVTILARDWRNVRLDAVWKLVVAAWLGIPVGVVVLTYVDENWIKLLLAALVIGFSAYNLARPELPELKSERLSPLFGFIAGFFGGACNVQGPPVVIYGSLRRWSAEDFRATMQAFALPTALGIMLGHGAAGNWTWRVAGLYLLCVPAVFAAVLAGRWVNRRIAGGKFVRMLYVLLLVLGLALAALAIRNVVVGA